MYIKQKKKGDNTMNLIKKFTTDILIPVIFAIFIALLIHKFVGFAVEVPSGSMLPTIQLQDRIIVSVVHNPENLKRGDIIVFDSDELHETLIKRLIGLPGDQVDVKEDGSVYINGEKTDQSYVKINGGKLGGSFKVPQGEYFFLGDNRSDSYDSRYWNDTYISADKIRGKALFVFFPFSRLQTLK